MPTHCALVVSDVFVVILLPISQSPQEGISFNGGKTNEVVPALQDPPAPNIMDPANQIGLFNPNAYVRGGAVEALGKYYGVMCLKKAAREGPGSADRIRDIKTLEAIERSVATGSIRSYTHPEFNDEEDSLFDDLIDMSADRTGAGTQEEEEGDDPVAGVEREPDAAAADATLENGGEENKTAAEMDGQKPAESQQKKKKKVRDSYTAVPHGR